MSVNLGESPAALADYEAEILKWRREKEEALTAEDGWLALIGLFWLREGVNTIGSDPDSDVPLTQGGVAGRLGTLMLQDGVVRLDVEARQPVTIDGVSVTAATLRDDNAPEGPTRVRVGTVSFYVMRRGDLYGIRARDSANPSRSAFTGRHWFPINPALRVPATFQRYETPRVFEALTSAGIVEKLKTIGQVEFEIGDRLYSLQTFESGADLWFILRDATGPKMTYGGGRFLYARLDADGRHLTLDFNKAYFPPCAYTPYAACPLPPPENQLPIAIDAGERY